MTKRIVLTLLLATVLTGSAGTQDLQAAEAGGSSARDAKRSAQSTSRLGADSTKDTGVADLRQRPGGVPHDRTRPGGKLTIQQKRLFVLGLWAAEKN